MSELLREEKALSFTDEAVQVCPFAAYRAVRAGGAIYREPDTGFYVVLDHALIRTVAADSEHFLNETGVMRGKGREDIAQVYVDNGIVPVEGLVTGDGPNHLFQRRLVEKVFTPSRVRQMEAYLTTVVDEMIDKVANHGWMDFYQEMAVMVPISVIADQVGVPRSDIDKFKRWSDLAAESTSPVLSPERDLELAQARAEFHRYLLGQANRLKEDPQSCLLNDLIRAEIDGRKPTDAEIVSIVDLLIIAGNETTTNALTSAMRHLIETDGLEAKLRQDPSLIPGFVEEVLRYSAPIQALFRLANVDMRIGDVEIPAGSIVVLRYGAGNHDEKQFVAPDVFDPQRTNARTHVTFGYGPHFCLGSHLARAELRLTFERVLARMKNLRLKGGDAVLRQPNYVTYGVSKLIVGFDPA